MANSVFAGVQEALSWHLGVFLPLDKIGTRHHLPLCRYRIIWPLMELGSYDLHRLAISTPSWNSVTEMATSARAKPLQKFMFTSVASRNSKLSTENKLIIYKVLMKPIWIHGTELWDVPVIQIQP